MRLSVKFALTFLIVLMLLYFGSVLSVGGIFKATESDKLVSSEIVFARSLADRFVPLLIKSDKEGATSILVFSKSLSDWKFCYLYVTDFKGGIFAHTFNDSFPAYLKEINTVFAGEQYYSQ